MISLCPRQHPHRFLALLLAILFFRGLMLMCILAALEGWDEHQHITLAFDMRFASNVGKLKPKEYYGLMEGVKRIVPWH